MLKIVQNTNIVKRNITKSCSCLNIERRNENEKSKIEEKVEEDRKKLQWRVPVADRPNVWYSKLKLFASDDKNSTLVEAMQQPIEFTPSALRKWWKRRQTKFEAAMQQFIPDRHRILGNDLAAAHFIVHRGGSVRFRGDDKWVEKDESDNYNLPSRLVPNMFVEAMKCDGMILFYEGLENIQRLKHLKYLSMKNIWMFDDWHLDRLTGMEYESLETLNLCGTSITEKGLNALYRIPSLKILLVDDPKKDKAWELTCAMLEEINPKLKIKTCP